MGACRSVSVDKNTEQIDQWIQEEKKKLQSQLKLLILGTGDSGKSTVVKQFRIHKSGGFTEEELLSYRPLVWRNMQEFVLNLLHGSRLLNFSLPQELETRMEGIMGRPIIECAQLIKDIWNHPKIQELFKRANEFVINEPTAQLLKDLDRICTESYIPTQQDALFCRVKTTGISETRFRLEKKDVLLVDVGGQRTERRKWINCFDNVDAVLFCVALSDYAAKLEEDGTTNRMDESVQLLNLVCNTWFTTTTVIVFLNKVDLFEEKLKSIPLTSYFTSYKGPNELEPAIEYMMKRLEKKDKSETPRLFFHTTNATDTGVCGKVLKAIEETIINSSFKQFGML